MKIRLYQVDAFTSKLFGGNPAAVCPLEKWPGAETLQSIANENNLSETAFFVKKGDGFELRWFTPKSEVDLCGHATLATSFVIFNLFDYKEKSITYLTKSGILKAWRDKDLITLDFPAKKQKKIDIPAELIDCLGAKPEELYLSDDYMAVFRNEDAIASLKPDFKLMMNLDCRGIVVTAKGDKVDFVSRFFAPQVGIDEDPVTGSAHCQLVPYWSEKTGKKKFHALQISERVGELFCENRGDRIMISGRAVKYLEGTIEI